MRNGTLPRIAFSLCLLGLKIMPPAAVSAQAATSVPTDVTFATPEAALRQLFHSAGSGNVDGAAAAYVEPYATLVRDVNQAGATLDDAMQRIANQSGQKQTRSDLAASGSTAYSILQPADSPVIQARGRLGLRNRFEADSHFYSPGKAPETRAGANPDQVTMKLSVFWLRSMRPFPVPMEVPAVKEGDSWKLPAPVGDDMTPQGIQELENEWVKPVRDLAAKLDKVGKAQRDGTYARPEDAVTAANAAVGLYRKAIREIPVRWPVLLPGLGEGEAAGSPMNDLPAAGNVVILCDATGSMLARMPEVKESISRTLNSLLPFQRFDILVYQDDAFTNLSHPSNQLNSVDDETKKQADDFITGISSRGSGDPIEAMEAAFHEFPDIIYLFTDGDFDHGDKLLQRLRELNAQGRVKVDVFGFIGNGADPAFEKVLENVAGQNGGVYQHVAEPEY